MYKGAIVLHFYMGDRIARKINSTRYPKRWNYQGFVNFLLFTKVNNTIKPLWVTLYMS